MQNKFKCPSCQGSIAIEDVNVATDIALCRACGKTTSFSMLSDSLMPSLDSMDAPPRGVTVKKDMAGATTIVYQRKSPVLFFLIPFTLLWSGVSIIGIYGTQLINGKFDLFQSLFGLPFLIGTFVLFGVIFFLFLGKWEIILLNGVGSVFIGVGKIGWTRRFSYNKDSFVSMQITNLKINNVPQKGILIRTNEKDFIFGAILKEDVKLYIAASILKVVQTTNRFSPQFPVMPR